MLNLFTVSLSNLPKQTAFWKPAGQQGKADRRTLGNPSTTVNTVKTFYFSNQERSARILT
jgi:hypothetical protein